MKERLKLVKWAANKIRSAYLLWRFLNVGPKIRKAKLARAAIMVQKYSRKYLSQKQVLKQLAMFKVNKCFDYFKEVQR